MVPGTRKFYLKQREKTSRFSAKALGTCPRISAGTKMSPICMLLAQAACPTRPDRLQRNQTALQAQAAQRVAPPSLQGLARLLTAGILVQLSRSAAKGRSFGRPRATGGAARCSSRRGGYRRGQGRSRVASGQPWCALALPLPASLLLHPHGIAHPGVRARVGR